MPRTERDKAAGLFHVYTRAAKWDDVFRDDIDRIGFLRELAYAGAKVGWQCLAYCLMTTHYHLLLSVGDKVLPKGMQSLNFRYASSFNSRHGTRGHVFGGRYESRRIADDFHLMTVCRYLALNPVRAQLCDAPADWVWSSYAGTVGRSTGQTFVEPAPILSCFGGTPERSRSRLRRFVEGS